MWLYIVIIVAVIIIIKKNEKEDKAANEYTKKMHKKSAPKKTQTYEPKVIQFEPTNVEEPQEAVSYIGKYKSRMMLTKNEYAAYKKLKVIADANGLLICPKVRLIDIVEPKAGEQEYALRAKVIQKHVDFVICNSDLKILGVIELDDNSHDTQKRMERDRFVDEILSDVGYTVIHTRYVHENTLDPIFEKAGT